jgi:diguanylate cyclase (GGDEF)-like protein
MTKVLVADDDEALRSLVSQVLEADGLTVEVAGDGDEAWARFQESLPELVLTDIRMPGRSGLELLSDIKKASPLTHVIIMTSHASFETAVSALKHGAYDYLIKPFEDLELISCAARRAYDSIRLTRERDELVTQLREHNDELERLNRMFRELAIKDGLTGLFNHRFAQEALHQEVSRSKLHERPMSVLFADVDYFKLYNDIHGHQRGDVLLRKLAACLRSMARGSEVIARWGGEEFVVIAPEADTTIATSLAQRMCKAVAGLEVEGRETQPEGIVSISIGVATLGEHAEGPAGLIAQADAALYKAKNGGRNTVRVAEGFVDGASTGQVLSSTMRKKILGT